MKLQTKSIRAVGGATIITPASSILRHRRFSRNLVGGTFLSQKRLVCAVLLSTAIFFPFHISDVGAAELKPLVFLGDKDYPPIAFLEEGKERGMDVDLAKALAIPMQREIRVELMDWNLAQEKTLRGEADGLLGMSITDERRKQFDFATPAFKREFGLLVRAGEMTIHGLSDLKGKSVGVTPGGFPRRFLEGKRDIRLVLINNYQEGFDRLANGTIHAMAADLWVATYLMEKGGIRGVTIAGKPIATTRAAIAFKRGNPDLVNEVSRAINLLHAEGKILEIQERWRPQEMLFFSRERFRRTVALGVGIFAAIVLGAMALWIFTLKKQIRIRKKVELALRESEERFQLAVRGSTDGLWDWNVLTNEVFHSDRLRELLGYSPAEYPDAFHAFESHLHPDDKDWVLTRIAGHLEKRAPYDVEYRLRSKSGEYRWFRARGQAIWNEEGRAVRMAGSITNITDRKRGEQLLRNSEERLQMLTDASFEGIAVCENGILVDTNDQLVKMLGYSKAEMIGKPVVEFVAPESRDYVRTATECGRADPYEHLAIRKDGTVFPVEVCGRTIDPGPPHIRVTAVRDVTERKRSEEALRKSEEKFSKVFMSAPAAMAVTRPRDARILDINFEFTRLFGYSREEAIGRTTVELGFFVKPNDREDLWQRTNSFGEVKDFEIGLYAKNRAIVIGRLSIQKVELQGEQLALSAFVDVTERKRAEEEVRASREQLRALAGRLQAAREQERTRIAREIHDMLAQELTRMKIDIGWLGKRLSASGPEVDRRVLSEKVAALSGLADVTITTVQKIAAELRPVVLDSLGLSAAIKWQAEEFQERTGILCEVTLPDEEFEMARDSATGIFRIVQESLTNVIRHANATRVDIILELDEDQLTLLVQDNGVGFEKGKMKDPYSLGLLGMHERAVLLEGQFEITSAPGKGTKVSVTMPLKQPSVVRTG